MLSKENHTLSATQLAMVLEEIPVGITVIDLDGHILYYNDYLIRFSTSMTEKVQDIDDLKA